MIIKLKDFGYNALVNLNNRNISREESVNQLIGVLGGIEEIIELPAFK